MDNKIIKETTERDFYALVYGIPPYINSMKEAELRVYAKRAGDMADSTARDAMEAAKLLDNKSSTTYNEAILVQVDRLTDLSKRLRGYAHDFAIRIEQLREGAQRDEA